MADLLLSVWQRNIVGKYAHILQSIGNYFETVDSFDIVFYCCYGDALFIYHWNMD